VIPVAWKCTDPASHGPSRPRVHDLGAPAAEGADSRRASMMSGRFVSMQSASASTLLPTVLPRGVNEYSTWGGTVS
jgi:hypothetical protein